MAIAAGLKYYEILDLPPVATDEQIRAAYRILVQLHHPDRLQQVPASVRAYAEERLKKINEAYRVLGDPERRASYDAAQRLRERESSYGGFDDETDEPAPDTAWGAPRRRARRQPPTEAQTRARAAAQAAYEEWAHKEAEKYAAARETERVRRAAREAQEAEVRARRAANEQFPRARLQGSEIVLHFGPSLWTTLLHVATGSFVMGSDPGDDLEAGRDEQPAHRVHLSEFYIGRFPVTNAQYRTFVTATGRTLSEPLPAGLDLHPVVNVGWDAANAFCQWLSASTSQTFRLPTEAEWEKAARGTNGRRYPWGSHWDHDRLNAGHAAGTTTPVDRFSPQGDSLYGVSDLLGNVWEWCSDWFDPRLYTRRAVRLTSDPLGPATGQGYVVRGGAFHSPPRRTRAAQRNWYYPDTVRPDLGFRIVAVPR
jgi:formylglycine-generating enzyme required for sulfatase activity